MSVENSDREKVKRRQSERLRRATGLTIFLCLVAISVASILHFRSRRQSLIGQRDRLRKQRDQLQTTATRMQLARNQSDTDKRILWNLLRQCRSADDIPALQGEHVIAQHQGVERLAFYVPEGDHQLEISATWKLMAKTTAPPTAAKASKNPLGTESWTVPLMPASGYILKFLTDRKGGPVTWELTGNSAEFNTVRQDLPLDDFHHTGASWRGSAVALFPNQIENRFSAQELQDRAAAPVGIELANTSLLGSCRKQSYRIDLLVRLKSEGPAQVSADRARTAIIMGQAEMLMPYEGGGKYKVRSKK